MSEYLLVGIWFFIVKMSTELQRVILIEWNLHEVSRLTVFLVIKATGV